MSKKIHHGRRGYASNRTVHASKEKREKRQGRRLVSEDGEPIWNNITDLLKTLKKEHTYFNYITAETALFDLIEVRKKQGRELTANGFRAILEENKIRKMLRNMGYTLEEFAEEYNIPVEDILNESNWDDNEFTCGDDTYIFRFGYNGNNLAKKVK